MSDTPKSGSTRPVRMAAVGDLLMAADPAGRQPSRDPAETFAAVRPILGDCDVVFGNLECTLAGGGQTVPTEPRVVSTAEMVREVARAGFNVVTLANNHAFDCLQGGFHNLRAVLDEMGVAHFGAGDDLRAASAPAILEVGGVRLAFLGAVDPDSGPYRFARPTGWGVAPLDEDRMIEQIRDLRARAHHVIVSLHWGQERLRIPSPAQVRQAHRFAEAGAVMVLGHHPHVIQGLETFGEAQIIYSLGNFVACDVPYTNGDVLEWSGAERTGCILLAELTDKEVRSVRQLATFDDGRTVAVDTGGRGERLIARANRAIARGVTLSRYRREYLWVKTIVPALRHLRWSKLKTLRARQLIKAAAGLFRAGRAR